MRRRSRSHGVDAVPITTERSIERGWKGATRDVPRTTISKTVTTRFDRQSRSDSPSSSSPIPRTESAPKSTLVVAFVTTRIAKLLQRPGWQMTLRPERRRSVSLSRRLARGRRGGHRVIRRGKHGVERERMVVHLLLLLLMIVKMLGHGDG